jgi:hypothetical protein
LAAPTFVASPAINTQHGNGTTVAFSWDDIAGLADNDVGILTLYKESTSTVTLATNWAEITGSPFVQDTGGFKFRQHVYWRRRASDTGAFTFSWTGSTWRNAKFGVWRNLITTETPIIGQTLEEETSQNTQPGHPGINITRSNSGLLWVVGNFSDADITTPPTGHTERADVGVAMNCFLTDDLTTTAGASGTVSATLSDPEWALSVLMELITEAAAGGGAAELASQRKVREGQQARLRRHNRIVPASLKDVMQYNRKAA